MRTRFFNYLCRIFKQEEGKLLKPYLKFISIILFPVNWLRWSCSAYNPQKNTIEISGKEFSIEAIMMLVKMKPGEGIIMCKDGTYSNYKNLISIR